MLHACVQRFDVTENLEKFCKILGTKHHICLFEIKIADGGFNYGSKSSLSTLVSCLATSTIERLQHLI